MNVKVVKLRGVNDTAKFLLLADFKSMETHTHAYWNFNYLRLIYLLRGVNGIHRGLKKSRF